MPTEISQTETPKEKWWLTLDSTMDYSIFVGTIPPKIEEHSGVKRFYSSGGCKSVLYSCKAAQFLKVFGVRLKVLECREINPIAISFIASR